MLCIFRDALHILWRKLPLGFVPARDVNETQQELQLLKFWGSQLGHVARWFTLVASRITRFPSSQADNQEKIPAELLFFLLTFTAVSERPTSHRQLSATAIPDSCDACRNKSSASLRERKLVPREFWNHVARTWPRHLEGARA